MAGRNPDGGGAEKTLAALKTEIIPWVEQHLRADPGRRVLTGSSYGGLFVLYTLLNEPDLFSGYVAPTPALLYADNFLPRLEAASAGKRKPARGRLFLTAGELESGEWRQSVLDFERALASRKNDDLVIQTMIIPGAGHSGQKAEAYTRGLAFVFGN
jgi:predicted alpha/beta superfamily hydrolase